jgi:hypothetical protein
MNNENILSKTNIKTKFNIKSFIHIPKPKYKWQIKNYNNNGRLSIVLIDKPYL